MPKHRSYRLLCPIARALDKVGDRWNLLILRDLHAGPARFGDLLHGLEGLASNLLSTRLQQLRDDGLVNKRSAEHGVVLYELTEEGEQTAPLLFELAAFGSRSAPPEDVRRPTNLRTVVVTLREALRRTVEDEVVHAELIIDDEPFSIDVEDGQVSVRYTASPSAAVSVRTAYEPLMAVSDGTMSLKEFASQHIAIERGTKKAANALFTLMGRAFQQ